MENKCMKQVLVLLATGKTQIKTTRYHYKIIIMDKIKIPIISKAGNHAPKLDHSDIAGGSTKQYSPSGK